MMPCHLPRTLLICSTLVCSLLIVGNHALPVHATSQSSYRPFSSAGPIWWTTSSSNTSGDMTHVNDPAINNGPNVFIQVTQLNLGNVDPHPFGVWYDASQHEWTIFNEDLQPIPLGTTFVISSWPGDFGTTTTANNSVADYTYIDNPATNGNPAAKVFVTQRWTGTYNAHEIGVWYTGTKWAIFNEDASPMANGATFNVGVALSTDSTSILQVATPQNTLDGSITFIDDPAFNGNPNLSLRVTQYWNGTYNNHPVDIWYDVGDLRWTIYNVDYQSMPIDTLFFVQIV